MHTQVGRQALPLPAIALPPCTSSKCCQCHLCAQLMLRRPPSGMFCFRCRRYPHHACDLPRLLQPEGRMWQELSGVPDCGPVRGGEDVPCAMPHACIAFSMPRPGSAGRAQPPVTRQENDVVAAQRAAAATQEWQVPPPEAALPPLASAPPPAKATADLQGRRLCCATAQHQPCPPLTHLPRLTFLPLPPHRPRRCHRTTPTRTCWCLI